MFHITFFSFPKSTFESLRSGVDNITMVLQTLGVTFSGSVETDDDLPLAEQRECRVTKKVAYYVGAEHSRVQTIRSHWRYQHDIATGVYLGLEVDQVLLHRRIPEIVATLQCCGHLNSTLS